MDRFCRLMVCGICLLLGVADVASGADWPMWRYDALRRGASPQELAPDLHLQWVRQYPPLKPAWPDQNKLTFDHQYEPVVAGRTMFFGSSHDDTLKAIDTRTGEEKWVFYAEGPIRLAPAVWEGKVYFACDDGYLYCVDASDGALRWKFRGGPSDRKIIGNERLISTWPARGGPVVVDGTVYFTASIWPFMGVFIHALDAESGEVVWTNDGDGSMFIKQPHNTNSFAGVAPQGALVIAGDRLIVPGGRSVPACYDRKTGKLLYYHLGANGKRGGGSRVVASTDYFFNGEYAFEVATGKGLGAARSVLVLDGDRTFSCSANRYQEMQLQARQVGGTDRRGKKVTERKWSALERWSVTAPGGTSLIKAGSRLYGGAKGQVSAVDLPKDGAEAKLSWQADIAGTPARLLAADDRLFVVTQEGMVYCFGTKAVDTPKKFALPGPTAAKPDAHTVAAKKILDISKVRSGYAVSWGAGTGRLIAELVRQSDLRVIAIEPDRKNAIGAREALTKEGVSRERASVQVGDPLKFELPAYLASLIVWEDAEAAGLATNPTAIKQLFHALRPYGGVACLRMSPDRVGAFKEAVVAADLAHAGVVEADGFVMLRREGALEGSANWTHEHADAANTRVSKDSVVKAPLGLLWFGGSSHAGILPRHGHGPGPQVIDGRLLIEGMDMLRAMDVYTGRVLWEASLPGVGNFYNNTSHEPGANATGTNFISMSDGIYVAYGKGCVRLDPMTGKTISEFKLPGGAASQDSPTWAYINVQNEFLVGTSDVLVIDESSGSVAGESSRPFQLWDVQARKLRSQPRGHGREILKVAFSPDSQTVATGSADRTAIIWDVMTGQPKATLRGHKGDVRGVAFSPDGRTVATGSKDKMIKLWDVASGREKATLVGHQDEVTAVAISPDGALLASGSSDKTVRLWDLQSNREIATLTGHTDQVNDVVFSPDGKTIASASEDKTVRLWDVATRKERVTLQGHRDHVNAVAFSPNGQLLATGSCDETVGLWNVLTHKMLTAMKGHRNIVNSVVFSPDGRLVFSGSRDQMVMAWGVADHKPADGFKTPGRVNCVAFSPDGKTFATGIEERVESASKENLSSSKQLVVMNRHNGKVLWTRQAQSGFRHNTICIGGGRLYCIDRMPQSEMAKLKRRGQAPEHGPRLLALDIETGEEIWSTEEGVFGTWLSYSGEHDVLVEAGRPGRDALRDEAKGIRVRHAGNGAVVWQNKSYVGPVLIHGRMLLKGRSACDLLTGEPKLRVDPLTGKLVAWTWSRNYGCNTPVASQNLLTFRSGAAGYFDLAGDGGTGNFGGFKSGCSNNLIVANGVLTAPDYTRTCTCTYQNQTSVGLIHMPEAEMWTEFPLAKATRIKHIAVNFGAPGHRRGSDGRLWLKAHENVKVTYEKFGYYRGYSWKFSGEGPNWVMASGCLGVSRVELDLGAAQGNTDRYTVRLHFADPDNDQPGRRVFDVALQGEPILRGFDIAKEAGGRNRGLVKEYKSVKVDDKLILEFNSSNSSDSDGKSAPILCGIEVVREEK